VITLEQTDFLLMDRGTFRASVEELPTMALNLANVLSRRLRLANAHLRSVAAMDVPGRVAAQVLALAREYGEPSSSNGTLIPLPLTQSDLAALVGASRVRVNQAIAFFKKRRYLLVGTDRRITVHDADAEVNHNTRGARAPLASHPRSTLNIVDTPLKASQAGALLIGIRSRSGHDLMP
jgi:CRP-like cAMP-binding protein